MTLHVLLKLKEKSVRIFLLMIQLSLFLVIMEIAFKEELAVLKEEPFPSTFELFVNVSVHFSRDKTKEIFLSSLNLHILVGNQ